MLQPHRLLQPIAAGRAGQGVRLRQAAVLLHLELQCLVEPLQFGGTLRHLLLQGAVLQLQPGVEFPLGVDVAVCPHHPGDTAVRVACDDAAAIRHPEVVTVTATAAVFGPVVRRPPAQAGIEALHDLRQIVRVDQVLPGEDGVVEGVWLIPQHLIPAGIAMDIAGVGIPVPETVAHDLQHAAHHGLVEGRLPCHLIVMQHENLPCSATRRHGSAC